MTKNKIDPKERLRRVELVPYNSNWQESFAREAQAIQKILDKNYVAVHHIGSTAIPNIHAKPIIDVLPIVKDLSLVDALNSNFEELGYTCMGEYGIKGRRFYWKSPSERTHHIHLFQEGSLEITRHVAFKDFLLKNPEWAKGYSTIKRCLAQVFNDDIESYVNGKGSFIQRVEYIAEVPKQSQLEAADNVELKSYNPIWPKLAVAEINAIKMMTTHLEHQSIHHLGSTAVPGLSSKPIIDLFIGIPSLAAAKQWVTALEYLGYVFWSDNPDKTHLRFFKGMPPFGACRTHHVHIVESSNPTLQDRILFKEILIRDEHVRSAYEKLKYDLMLRYSKDREAYTDGKIDFIREQLKKFEI